MTLKVVNMPVTEALTLTILLVLFKSLGDLLDDGIMRPLS